MAHGEFYLFNDKEEEEKVKKKEQINKCFG